MNCTHATVYFGIFDLICYTNTYLCVRGFINTGSYRLHVCEFINNAPLMDIVLAIGKCIMYHSKICLFLYHLSTHIPQTRTNAIRKMFCAWIPRLIFSKNRTIEINFTVFSQAQKQHIRDKRNRRNIPLGCHFSSSFFTTARTY